MAQFPLNGAKFPLNGPNFCLASGGTFFSQKFPTPRKNPTKQRRPKFSRNLRKKKTPERTQQRKRQICQEISPKTRKKVEPPNAQNRVLNKSKNAPIDKKTALNAPNSLRVRYGSRQQASKVRQKHVNSKTLKSLALWDTRNSKHNKSQWYINFSAKRKARNILRILGKEELQSTKIPQKICMTEFNVLKILGIEKLNALYISRIVAWSPSKRKKIGVCVNRGTQGIMNPRIATQSNSNAKISRIIFGANKNAWSYTNPRNLWH